MLTALAFLLAAQAEPGCPVSSAELDAHLLRALAAVEQHRYLDFERERRAAEAQLDCVGEVIRDQTLVNLHLVSTARAWLDGDEEALLAGLRGLRVVNPGFVAPQSWTEHSDGMRDLLHEASSLGPGREARLPGRLVVDGHVTAQYLPVERACVVQVRNTEGSWTAWYLAPGEPASAWLMANQARQAHPAQPAAPVPAPGLEEGG
jgi:hypothetical protein